MAYTCVQIQPTQITVSSAAGPSKLLPVRVACNRHFTIAIDYVTQQLQLGIAAVPTVSCWDFVWFKLQRFQNETLNDVERNFGGEIPLYAINQCQCGNAKSFQYCLCGKRELGGRCHHQTSSHLGPNVTSVGWPLQP